MKLKENIKRRTIELQLQDTIVSYCLRVIEQSKMKRPDSKPTQLPDQSDIALVESIRILDVICTIDQQLVARIFPVLKKVLTRSTSKSSCHLILTLLRFFINHSDTVMYDPEPLFRSFFEQYLLKHCISFVLFVFVVLLKPNFEEQYK